ncbi:MAG TPA: PAS domain S-box protein, partial [Kofleriaceae bacterium]
MSDRAESLRTLEPMVEAVRDPALVVRGDASAELANPALCTYTGLAHDRLLGFGWLGAIYQADPAASPAYWLALLARGQRFDVELRLRRYNGTFAPLHVQAVPLSERAERWFVTAVPIVTRRGLDDSSGEFTLGDKALRALMFQYVREAAFAWQLDSRPRILLWNHAAEQMYGYSLAEVLDRSPHSVLRTEFPMSLVHLEAALRRDGRWTGELRHYTRGGELLHVDTSLELVDLADGRRVVLESCRDITARRRDEQSLLEVQTRLRLALAASGTGIWDWQIGSDRIFGSPETFAIVGAAPDAFAASREDFARRIHPDDRERVWAEVARSVEDGRDLDCEFRIVRDDGAVRWLHDRALVERDASGQAVRLIGTVRDVTADRELSERLAASEARFRALAEAMPQIVWTCDARGEVDWINQRWTAVTGVTLEDARGAGWAGVVHPDDLPGLLAGWQVAVERGEAYEIEYRLRATDGAYRWFLGRAEPIRAEHGVVARWFATATDIDQRVRAEIRLRASERRFQIAFESNPQPTVITRVTDGVCLAVNSAFLAMSGFARDEVLGRSGVDLGLWAADRRAQLLDSLVSAGQLRDTPFQLRARDGRIREILISSARIELDGVDCLLNVVSDVTDRRAAEAALRDSEEAARIRAEEMEVLIASVPAAIWITRDRDARFVDGSTIGYEQLRMQRPANL